MSKFLITLGTRPEAIKLLPLYSEMMGSGMDVLLYSSGQHSEMLKQVFCDFGIYPDVSDDIFEHSQPLPSLLSKIIENTGALIRRTSPKAVITQGDTVTAFGASLAAFLLGVPVCHVEAGLRTFDFSSPFPEEYFRTSIDSFCKYLFAPNDISRQNLINEGINKNNIFVTGNTVIDAVRMLCPPIIDDKMGRTALFTMHRRESDPKQIKNAFFALKELALKYPDLNIYYPVHPTKRVSDIAYKELSGIDNIILTPPLSPKEFYSYLSLSDIVLTDSGGVQEEAAILGIPTLVLREKTERVGELLSGKITLVGFDPCRIVRGASEILNNNKKRGRRADALFPSKSITKILSEVF